MFCQIDFDIAWGCVSAYVCTLARASAREPGILEIFFFLGGRGVRGLFCFCNCVHRSFSETVCNFVT